MSHRRALLGLIIGLTAVTNAYAWGPRGHRITAIIAERHLTEPAARQVDELLDGESLAEVANWADEVRNDRPATRPLHFVDIPRSATEYRKSRDCANDECILEAIEKFRKVLVDPNETPDQRAEALKFIVHFVGDMHQPLHCADDNDRGGNDVRVRFLKAKSNLHQVWDSRLIDRARIPDNEDYADELEALLETGDEARLMSGTTIDWANAAHQVAVTNAYAIPASRNLGKAYVNRNLPVVDEQLLAGGLRLAKILNDNLR